MNATVVCPFCSLLCDDLRGDRSQSGELHFVVPARDSTNRIVEGALATDRSARIAGPSSAAVVFHPESFVPLPCERAGRGFAARRSGASSRGSNGSIESIESNAATATDPVAPAAPANLRDDPFVKRASALLAAAGRPLFGGLVTDVAGIRAALDLAEFCGAQTDHLNGAARMVNLVPLQQHGGQLTTLSEVRNRADLVVFVGGEPLAPFPRFEERILAPLGEFLADDAGAGAPRACIRLGSSQATRLPIAFEHPGGLDVVLELIGTVLMLIEQGGKDGQRELSVHLAGRPDLAAARRLLSLLRAARYPVFIWNSLRWPAGLGQRLSLRMMRLVTALNRTQRAAALPVGGNDGEASAEAVHLWRTGYPFRSIFASTGVRFEPTLAATEATLAGGRTDALLWISGLGLPESPPPSPGPRIVLGPPGMDCDADVFIAVGTPGLDHDAHLVRMDRVITMFLPARDRRPLPSVATVLDAMLANLRASSPERC